jgi:hypothetical protein
MADDVKAAKYDPEGDRRLAQWLSSATAQAK